MKVPLVFFSYEFKTVLSGFLESDILTGFVIGIRPVENSEYFQENDIITYQTADKILVTHLIAGGVFGYVLIDSLKK